MSKPRKSTDSEPEPEPDTVLDAAAVAANVASTLRAAEVIVPEYGVSMEEISRRQRPADLNPLN